MIKKIDDWANFILRRITEDSVEINTMLGGFYTFIDKIKSPEIFKETTKEWLENDLTDCYALVVFFNDSIIPLYKGSEYYIMTDTGGTVDNKTKK
jgi:hypothetical protein